MKIKVSFEAEVKNENVTIEEIQQWLEFELGQYGFIKSDHPLRDEELEATWIDCDLI